MWHGMGDASSSFGMDRIKRVIEDNTGGAYVYSLKIGENSIAERLAGFFGQVDAQVQLACDLIAADPELQNGYHSIGFSQASSKKHSSSLVHAPQRVCKLKSQGLNFSSPWIILNVNESDRFINQVKLAIFRVASFCAPSPNAAQAHQ
jgi:hypothetical protein